MDACMGVVKDKISPMPVLFYGAGRVNNGAVHVEKEAMERGRYGRR